MLTIEQILDDKGREGVEIAKGLLRKYNATGKTVESVKYIVTDTSNGARLRITARPFTSALETGIKPVSAGSKPGIPPEMIKNLTEYAQARGMEDPKKAAWAIAKKIKKVGDKTYRQGGKDVYSDAMDNFVEEIKQEVLKSFKTNLKLIFK